MSCHSQCKTKSIDAGSQLAGTFGIGAGWDPLEIQASIQALKARGLNNVMPDLATFARFSSYSASKKHLTFKSDGMMGSNIEIR